MRQTRTSSARLWYIYVGSDSINHYRDFDDIPVILFWNITFFSWQLDIIITRCVHKLSRERGKDNKADFIATWILETPLTPSDALIVWTKDAVVVFLCKCMSLIAPCFFNQWPGFFIRQPEIFVMYAMFGIRNLLLIYLQIDWTLLEARERERECHYWYSI